MKLSFLPKYHHQIESGEAAGQWTARPLGQLSREAMKESFIEAETIVAQGHVLLVFDMNPIIVQRSPGDSIDRLPVDYVEQHLRESRKVNSGNAPQQKPVPYYQRFSKSKF